MFLNDPNKLSKMKAGSAALPPFWRKALETLDTMPLVLKDAELLNKWQARAEPLWYSHNFTMDVGETKRTWVSRYQKLWEEDLQTSKIGDLLTK